jgi:hypothetical protein
LPQGGDMPGAKRKAKDLMAEVSESLADKLAAFERIGKWIAIKHRLGTARTRSYLSV